MSDHIAEAQARFERWRSDAVAFVLEVFTSPPSLDIWQREGFEMLPVSPRLAFAACKGPGKTCWLAMAAWWLMACHVDAQGEALSITNDPAGGPFWSSTRPPPRAPVETGTRSTLLSGPTTMTLAPSPS